MTLRSAPTYWYECDTCGRKKPAWSDPLDAWADAKMACWVEVGGLQFCTRCKWAAIASEPDDRAGGLPPLQGTDA